VLAYTDFASGTDEAFPFIRIGRKLAGQQDFDTALKEVARRGVGRTDRLRSGTGPATEEPGGKHAGVVENQEVTVAEEPWKVAERAIEPEPGGAIEMEHPRGGAVLEGLLGDAVGRKIEVKIGDQHEG
jgi:hypothetical protein